MSIKALAQFKQADTTNELLKSLREHNLSHLNDYLLFNLKDKMKEELFQHLDFLDDDNLWTKEELTSYQIIARTIDNDFILSNNTDVLVIPSHLYKTDSEIFSLSIWDFLIQFEEKKLNTHILALN